MLMTCDISQGVARRKYSKCRYRNTTTPETKWKWSIL